MTAPAAIDTLPAEQALLGALLYGGRLDQVLGIVSLDHFEDDGHRRLFAAILDLAEAGAPVSLSTVAHQLADAPEFVDEPGGVAGYSRHLFEAFSNPAEAPHYARLVLENHNRRRLVAFAAWLDAEARRRDLDGGAAALVAQAEAELAEILERPEGVRRDADLDGVLSAAWEAVQRAQSAIGGISGISTGLHDLDRLLGGLQPTDLIIIAGRPSMGKTVAGLTIATNAAASGYVGRFNSLEMSRAQLGQRLYARRSGVSTIEQRGHLRPDQLAALEEARGWYGGMALVVDDQSGLTAGQIRARARAQKRRRGLDLLCVDYLGLLAAADPQANRTHQLEAMTRTLKECAKELEIPVVLLCQINRGVEGREDKRPGLADLRDSGAIEQDADVVAFVYREQYYLERAEPAQRADEPAEKFSDRYHRWRQALDRSRNVGEIIVAKNRQGETGIARVRFDGRRQVFEDLHGAEDAP